MDGEIVRNMLCAETHSAGLYLVLRSFQMVIVNITSRGDILSTTNNISYNIQKDEETQRFALLL